MCPVLPIASGELPGPPPLSTVDDDHRDLLQALIASIQDYAIFLLDVDGNVVTWNAGAQRLKGYTAEEVIGSHFSRFYTPEGIEAGKPEIELVEAAAKGRFEDEGWRLRKDGTTFWANVVVTALYGEDGELRGFGKVTRDLTERRAQEEELRVSRDRLERSTRELERSNADLEQFAFAASHDLQQPLRQVSGFTQLLRRRYADQLDPSAAEYLDRVVTGTERMQRLIRDLLAFARLGQEERAVETVPLGGAVDQAIGDLGAAIEETGATIEVGELPIVSGNAQMLALVFQNLIGNALKFRRPDVPPLVTVGAERSGDRWRIAVTDDGIGVEPEHAERIFRIFERLHSHDDFEGTGLGLAMCRKIVESFDGEISLDANSGLAHGSRFLVELPA